jgi:ubiquinone/menaquinone biosynthesis C-methylase UbiE
MPSGLQNPFSERSQQVYDWWGERQFLYKIISYVNAPARERTSEELALTDGETVLEVGCGPGVNFPMLREGVGPEGAVIGIDSSSSMIQRAVQRQDEHNWSNVQAIRGDATRIPLSTDTFDAALASLVLSVIPDARGVIETVYESLKPGGQFVVYDSWGEYREGPAQLLNPLHSRFVRYMFDHQLEQNILQELQTVFETVDIVETFKSNSEYVAVAVKSADGIE